MKRRRLVSIAKQWLGKRENREKVKRLARDLKARYQQETRSRQDRHASETRTGNTGSKRDSSRKQEEQENRPRSGSHSRNRR
ncbi:MAG TPA: hypothetical protein VK110_06320 [Salinisphaeraceae bacterium]|nr:hypothetical protein [Salinisphaeraceae bacterium]